MANKQLNLLVQELKHYKRHAFAETTKVTYKVHLRAFLRFCIFFNLTPVPCEKLTVLLYVVYLSRSLKPESIRQYLNIIRIVHVEAGLPNPLDDFYSLTLVLRGIKRLKGTPTVPKAPITPEILRKMHTCIDLDVPFWATFWAACLTAFFCFFRKSTLLCKTATKVDSRNALRRSDMSPADNGFTLHVRHTKTLQYHERVLDIPLAKNNTILCPVNALEHMLKLSPCDTGAPLFSYRETATNRIKVLDFDSFNKALKLVLRLCGLGDNNLSPHSFRRGGATYALTCGATAIDIKTQGDWKSNAWERYIDPPASHRWNVANLLAAHIRPTTL